MPCHKALEEMAAAWQRLSPEQRQQLQIVLVSIDDEQAGVLEFLKQRGWHTLGETLWAGAGGWNAPAAQEFSVNSIPRQILIDPNGRVLLPNAKEPLESLLLSVQDALAQAGNRAESAK